MNYKLFFRSLLHALYGGAIAGLAQSSQGALTPKGIGISLLTGALTGAIQFFSTKPAIQ